MPSQGVTIVVDGEVVTSGGAIPALDRGFLLGDAAFEVLRVYAGRPFMLEAHIARLMRSLAILRFARVPERGVIERELRLALAAAGLADAYVRIAITRGNGLGLAFPDGASPRVITLVAPLVLPPAASYSEGVAAIVVASPFEAGALRSGGAKTTSYLEHVLAADEARAQGAYEAIFMAPTGQILEGAASNVFVVHEGTLLTPPASTGILAGITRACVLACADADGISAREALVTRVMLARASEVFLTSSIRGLVPVVTIDQRPVGEGVPGPVFARISGLYADRTAE